MNIIYIEPNFTPEQRKAIGARILEILRLDEDDEDLSETPHTSNSDSDGEFPSLG